MKNVQIAEEEKEEVKIKVQAGWMSEDQMREHGMKEYLALYVGLFRCGYFFEFWYDHPKLTLFPSKPITRGRASKPFSSSALRTPSFASYLDLRDERVDGRWGRVCILPSQPLIRKQSVCTLLLSGSIATRTKRCIGWSRTSWPSTRRQLPRLVDRKRNTRPMPMPVRPSLTFWTA